MTHAEMIARIEAAQAATAARHAALLADLDAACAKAGC